MSRTLPAIAICAAAFASGCDLHPASPSSRVADAASPASPNNIVSAIPADRLAPIKAALPQVAYGGLQRIFQDPDTYWYDAQSMARSYQETGFPGGGARDNAHWFELVAPVDSGHKVYDTTVNNWRFPFAATAGTDDSTNVQIVNFLSLPKDANGHILSIPLSTEQDQIHLSWVWQYPNGTAVGEVMFIKDANGGLTCTEVRLRTRYAGGWATNAFRPFPTAAALSQAIKTKRPSYASSPQLNALVQHLDGNDALTPEHLTAEGLPGTFDQAGYLDVLPDFGDTQLVHDLLTTTPFVSAYGTVWKDTGGTQAFAASTASDYSIVPKNYTAGIVEVTEDSCMRCHKEAARKLEEFYPDLTLYGEIWGKDAIFTFHPFDESYYPDLDLNEVDNRHINPKLSAMGMVEPYDPNKHTGPFYDRH